MSEIEYLTDKNGKPKAVVIPIEVWQKIMPDELEDYCLNQAMDKAQNTPLLDREAALQFLEEEI